MESPIATFRTLDRSYPAFRDVPKFRLSDRKDPADVISGRNSGVIHSGIYYKPGSHRATNCVEGRRELVRFAKEHKISHDICGKIIVATDVSELAHMNTVFVNERANGVEDIELKTSHGRRNAEARIPR
ncbi:MAG: FAD-dependent oxidoreductase [Gammaproteobacteria bacterium]